MNVNTENCTAK